MLGSAILYSGLLTAAVGMLLALKTIWRRNRPRTRASLKTTFAGLLVTVAALLLPAPEQRSARVERR